MKFCPVVPVICHGQVHASRKERIRIIIRNGAKTISLQTLFGRLNYPRDDVNPWSLEIFVQKKHIVPTGLMCVGYARVVIGVGFVGTRHHSIDTCEMIEWHRVLM
jgi:hypothetical protein